MQAHIIIMWLDKLLVFCNAAKLLNCPKLLHFDIVHEEGWDLLTIPKGWMHWRLAAPPRCEPHGAAILCIFGSLPLLEASVLASSDNVWMNHPGLHKHFMNRLHVIVRNDRFWADLSPDLVIEQELLGWPFSWSCDRAGSYV